MAVALATSYGGWQGSLSGNDMVRSFTVSGGADRLLVVYARSATTKSIAYGGVALTRLTPQQNTEVWVMVNPPTGTANVVVTQASAVNGYLNIAEFTGVDQTVAYGTLNTLTGSTGSTASTTSETCPTDGAVYGAIFANYTDGSTPTAASGTTLIGNAYRDGGSGENFGAGYRLNTGSVGLVLGGSPSSTARISLPINPVGGGADTTPPELTSPTGSATGSTTANVGATTDKSNGTMYAWATANATESAADIKTNGTTQAISSTGAKTIGITGLTASTAYYGHVVHRDAAGNDSDPVHSAQFTTDAPSTDAGFDFDTADGFVFGDLAGALTGLAREGSVSIVVRAYDVVTGALVLESDPMTTDSAGRLARWEDAEFEDATEYHLVFIRDSDGEICSGKLTTS